MPALTGRISTPLHRYRSVLATPGARKFFLAAAPARIGIAMTSLGIVWLVHDATGSYAVAGVVTGGFAVAEALAGPQVARLIDRFGQTRMLPLILLGHALAVALLIGLTATGAETWSLVVAGVLAGGSIPQVGAQASARWAYVLRGRSGLSTAFALEALSTGLAFMVGPAVVGTVSSVADPIAGSILATALVVVGGLSLAVQRRTAPPPARTGQAGRPGQLLRRGFLALIATNIGIGLFFGCMQVSVTAFAVNGGTPSLAGPLYGITSLVSLVAGFVYGSRQWPWPADRQFVVVLAGLTVTTIPLLLADSPLGLGLALALPGLAIAPFQTLSAVLAESRVAPTVLTQAFTWLNSGSAAGIALGAALTGHVVDTTTPRHGFTLALAATLAAATVAFLFVHRARKQPPEKVNAL